MPANPTFGGFAMDTNTSAGGGGSAGGNMNNGMNKVQSQVSIQLPYRYQLLNTVLSGTNQLNFYII